MCTTLIPALREPFAATGLAGFFMPKTDLSDAFCCRLH